MCLQMIGGEMRIAVHHLKRFIYVLNSAGFMRNSFNSPTMNAGLSAAAMIRFQ